MHRAEIHIGEAQAPGHGLPTQGVPVRTSVRRTLLVVAIGLGAAAANTLIAYLAMGITDFIAIMASVIFGLVVAVALRFLHRAWWLAALSLLPSLMVMFGAGDYTPHLALEQRGVREQVVITADSAAGTESNRHAYTLRGEHGVLAEKLVWRGGGSPYRVGDRIEILRDPEGIAPLWDRADVDSAEKMDWLLWGTATWTAMALLAGYRGHIRRKKNKQSLLDRFDI
ncbi:hypothetical protein ACFXG1_14665 [Streptomyces sp. NPDC059248]|uniref:hypothetical protein n=1 Tax=Streptomyces sp. NPDC059248 TaxID=3346791 RepID=UPI00367F69F7